MQTGCGLVPVREPSTAVSADYRADCVQDYCQDICNRKPTDLRLTLGEESSFYAIQAQLSIVSAGSIDFPHGSLLAHPPAGTPDGISLFVPYYKIPPCSRFEAIDSEHELHMAKGLLEQVMLSRACTFLQRMLNSALMIDSTTARETE